MDSNNKFPITGCLSIVFFVFIFIFGIILTNKCFHDITKYDNQMKENIGSKIIIEKDTLLIIDYSIINNSYTLSNGKIINNNLLKKSIIIK
jgi:hypothetical protein